MKTIRIITEPATGRLLEGKRFGLAFIDADGTPWAVVREGLPERVRLFVTAHEVYHLVDVPGRWLWREIKANLAGALAYPLGALEGVWLTVKDPSRWRYYWARLRGRAN